MTMRHESYPVKIRLPPLSDEAVVEIHDFLYDFIERFESHYEAQIHRYYEDHSAHNIVQQHPCAHAPDDDPPF
jgi:hypothetical protein